MLIDRINLAFAHSAAEHRLGALKRVHAGVDNPWHRSWQRGGAAKEWFGVCDSGFLHGRHLGRITVMRAADAERFGRYVRAVDGAGRVIGYTFQTPPDGKQDELIIGTVDGGRLAIRLSKFRQRLTPTDGGLCSAVEYVVGGGLAEEVLKNVEKVEQATLGNIRYDQAGLSIVVGDQWLSYKWSELHTVWRNIGPKPHVEPKADIQLLKQAFYGVNSTLPKEIGLHFLSRSSSGIKAAD